MNFFLDVVGIDLTERAFYEGMVYITRDEAQAAWNNLLTLEGVAVNPDAFDSTWETYDLDFDGRLTRFEFENFLNFHHTAEGGARILEYFDANDDGLIDREEFNFGFDLYREHIDCDLEDHVRDCIDFYPLPPAEEVFAMVQDQQDPSQDPNVLDLNELDVLYHEAGVHRDNIQNCILEHFH